MPISVPPPNMMGFAHPPALGRWSVGLLVTAALLAVPTAAAAHPFGPPLVANVAIEDDAVLVDWSAAEDDWVALGRGLGVLDGPTDAVDPDATVPRTGFERIADSEEVTRYLLDHIGVHQQGVACEGAVNFPDDIGTLLATGVTIQFTCPDNVDTFDLTITALTDVHEAYRTVSTLVATPEVRTVHTWADATHFVDPDAGGNRIERRDLAGLTALAALVCLVAGLTLGRGPNGRRAETHPAPPDQRDRNHADPPSRGAGAPDLTSSGAGREVP